MYEKMITYKTGAVSSFLQKLNSSYKKGCMIVEEKCKILKGSILTQEEQMQLSEHNKHFHFDKSTNLHNKLMLRNIRPMR